MILFSLLLAFLVFGCAQDKTGSLEQQVAALKAQLAATQDQLAACAKRTVTLYFIEETPRELYLVPELRELEAREVTPEKVLGELIAGPKTPDLKPVLPKEVKVRGVRVEKGIAFADFSEEITRLNVGSRGEALVLASIANTLIKLPEIEKVQILVEGKKVETLAGHLEASVPLGRNETVLKLD